MIAQSEGSICLCDLSHLVFYISLPVYSHDSHFQAPCYTHTHKF